MSSKAQAGNSSQRQAAAQQAMPTTLEGIIAHCTSSTSPAALADQLRAFSNNRDAGRELTLAGTLPGGQDPLELLDVTNDTIGWAFLLSARLSAIASRAINTGFPPLQALTHFCENHDPEQAYLVQDRMTLFARSLVECVEISDDLELPTCIPLLLTLLNRYVGGLSTLTPIHAIFTRLCVRTRHFNSALPVLRTPITSFSPTTFPLPPSPSSSSQPLQPPPASSSSTIASAFPAPPSARIQKAVGSDLLLQYADHLVYYYAGGIALAVLRHWAEAEEFLEAAVTAPVLNIPSAIQFEAMKKLGLVQLILHGKTKELPKYTSTTLPKLFRSTPYAALINAFPLQRKGLQTIALKEKEIFEQDRNMSLVNQVIDFAPRWCLQRLTATYSTLSLAEIAEHVGLVNEATGSFVDQARDLVSSMIDSGELAAELDAEGYVNFAEVEPSHVFSKERVEGLLRGAQAHALQLVELDKEILRSKEFLGKAMKNRDDIWGMGEDDAMFGGIGDMKVRMNAMDWTDENLFE